MALKRKTTLKRTPFKRKPKEDKEKDKEQKKTTKAKKPRKTKTNRQHLIEKLDKVFSQYIRLRDASPRTGLCRCITCGRVKHWKEMQAGHYASRANMATRWDTRNVHVQDAYCNVMLHGNMIEYRHAMVKKYGEKTTDYIEMLSHTSKKWSEWELDEMIIYFTALRDKELQDKGLSL